MSVRTGWVLIVVACIACGGKKEPPATGAEGSAGSAARGSGSASTGKIGAGRLFSEVEIAGWVDGLMKRLEANAKRTCPGPKVTATTTPGPASDALVQLVEGKGEIAGCMTRLSELAKGGSLKADIDRTDPKVAEFDAACGATIADKVMEAAAHAEGCSPYQTGVRVEPKDLMRAIQLAHVVAFHARQVAAGGKPVEAVQLSLGALRAFQDLTRGHVTLLLGMISAAASEIVGANLDQILDTVKINQEQRAELATELDALLAAMPLWADLMAGERDNMDIYFGAARLMPKDWVPPGGWNEELRPQPTGSDGSDESDRFPVKHFGNPRDEAAVLLAVTADNAAELAKLCPEGASYAVCQRAMTAIVAQAKPTADADLKAMYAELAKAAATGAVDLDAVRLRIRSAVIKILKSIMQPNMAKYPIKLALVVARLAELRIHLEVEKTGTCPTAAELTAPPYSTLGAPAALGDALDLKNASGTIEVRPPSWTDPTKVWSFHCFP